ncbi:hypothetical protein C0995_011748 [Termitomyces sp. Mi166|nr:hypothetical protein C0995_011748 [Termitomyces sp. Mi166\
MLSENAPQPLRHRNAIFGAQSFDERVFFLLRCSLHPDASDFYNSSIFAEPDPESGLGGWGNPNTDARVLNGAFSHTSGFRLSYPYPHTLTRNFTLRPFLDYPEAETWHVIRDKMANVSCSPQSIEKTINGWIGDYRGFQYDLEAIQVRHKGVSPLHFVDLATDRLHTSLFIASWAGIWPGDARKNIQLITRVMSTDLFTFLWLRTDVFLTPCGISSMPVRYEDYSPLTSTLAMQMMDKIWYEWQLKHPENLNAFSGGSKAAITVEETEMYPVGMPPDLTVDLFPVLSLIT